MWNLGPSVLKLQISFRIYEGKKIRKNKKYEVIKKTKLKKLLPFSYILKSCKLSTWWKETIPAPFGKRSYVLQFGFFPFSSWVKVVRSDLGGLSLPLSWQSRKGGGINGKDALSTLFPHSLSMRTWWQLLGNSNWCLPAFSTFWGTICR